MKILTLVRVLAVAAALLPALFTSATAQQNWSWANSLPASIQWKDVAYGNGLYVAVGLDATIATSPDAATWTIRRMSTAQMSLNSIAYANGLFVAVGMGTPTKTGAALIMTSPDGIAWTINDTVANDYSAQLFSALYGGGTWVVSGSSGSATFTSTDGLTWTQRTTPSGVIVGTGAYGAGLFVLSGNGNTVLTSPDGATWTRTAVAGAIGASSPVIFDVAFTGGKFVAVGRDSNFVGVAYTSTDAVTWTPSNAIANSSNGFITVATNGSTFVAAGNANLFSSPDGVTWTKQTSALTSSARQLGPQFEGASGAAFANGLLFVLGNYGSITTSTDGATWTRRSTGTTNDLLGLLYNGTQFVASGSGGTILTSTDGTVWSQLTTGTAFNFGKIAYDGTRYVTADFNGILTSTNLTAWTQVTGTGSERYANVVYGNNRFVAAYSATLIGTRTSSDGVTWSAANNIANTGGNTNGIVFGNGLFMLTTGGGGGATKILSSPDGIAWTDRTPAGLSTTQFDSLAFGGGRFVALTYDHRSATSTDGINWMVNTLPSSPTFSLVMYAGTQFIARSSGYGASSYGSADGATWTLIPNSTAPNNGFAAIAANGSTVVGISSSGVIIRGDLAAATGPTGPTITTPPAAQTAIQGATATFTVVATGGTLSYQWKFNGTALIGATSATLTLTNVQSANAGTYTVDVSDSTGTTTSLGATLTVTPNPGRIANLSVRANVGTGNDVLIIGYVIGGNGTSGNKAALIRAAGPSLSSQGVTTFLADPQVDIVGPGGSPKYASNNDWAGDAQVSAIGASVGAFPFAAPTSKDAAVYQATFAPQVYSAIVFGVGNTSGVAVAEIYDATPDVHMTATTPRLLNISGRANVGTGDNVLIGGFVITGSTNVKVLIRGLGPTLAGQGVTTPLADPKLDVYQHGVATAIATNDDWGAAANSGELASTATAVGATPLAAGSKDSALILTLAPGVYSAIVYGAGNTSGVALVEIYEVP